jgi:transposase
VDAHGRPIAAFVASASVHESQLVEPTLEKRWVKNQPTRLIGDKAYDSDELDAKLWAIGIEMIAPHKKNRVKPKTQDGRKLRRAKRRFKIERTNGWIKNYRRLCLRYEWYSKNVLGFVLLAAVVLYLKNT